MAAVEAYCKDMGTLPVRACDGTSAFSDPSNNFFKPINKIPFFAEMYDPLVASEKMPTFGHNLSPLANEHYVFKMPNFVPNVSPTGQ